MPCIIQCLAPQVCTIKSTTNSTTIRPTSVVCYKDKPHAPLWCAWDTTHFYGVPCSRLYITTARHTTTQQAMPHKSSSFRMIVSAV